MVWSGVWPVFGRSGRKGRLTHARHGNEDDAWRMAPFPSQHSSSHLVVLLLVSFIAEVIASNRIHNMKQLSLLICWGIEATQRRKACICMWTTWRRRWKRFQISLAAGLVERGSQIHEEDSSGLTGDELGWTHVPSRRGFAAYWSGDPGVGLHKHHTSIPCSGPESRGSDGQNVGNWTGIENEMEVRRPCCTL